MDAYPDITDEGDQATSIGHEFWRRPTMLYTKESKIPTASFGLGRKNNRSIDDSRQAERLHEIWSGPLVHTTTASTSLAKLVEELL